MQDSLYEFLILNKQLRLPGIGTIGLFQNPSQHDVAEKLFTPPSFFFKIESSDDKPSKKLFDWLSASKGITEWEAIKSLNEFSFEIKKRISDSGEMNWEKVGRFRRNDNGNIQLDPHTLLLSGEQPVRVEKVIRQNASHTVLVGDQERTSMQMEDYFAPASPKKNYSWIIAVILTIVALMFIGWYFSEKGFAPSAAGNQSVVKSN
jgi:hypothetical protein